MAEQQQQAAQTPSPTSTTTPAATPPADDLKFGGDVSALLATPAATEEVQDEPNTGAADSAGAGEDHAKALPADDQGDGGDKGSAESGGDDAGGDTESAAGTAPGEGSVADPEPEPQAEETAPAPAAPAQTPQPTPQQQRDTRKGEVRTQLREISGKLKELKEAGDVDPFAASTLQADATILQNELAEINNAEVEEFRAAKQVEDFWATWAKENPAIGDKGREAYLEEEAAAIKRFAPRKDATDEERALARAGAVSYATAKWEDRLSKLRGQAELKARKAAEVASAPAKPTAPAGKGKPGGPPTIPATTTAARAVRQNQTPVEQLAARAGAGIKNFLD